jgi:putative DNA methylase
LLKFIGDIASWDHAASPTWLSVGRGLVRAASGEDIPLVTDPFSGGGAIPLEALRLGCETFASDLNPVACLNLKTLLVDIPRHKEDLVEAFRRIGKSLVQQARQ